MARPPAAIYTVFTSPHHAPMPNHLPTLIVTPHGQPNQVLYTYLHTEENKVNYLLTPSPQGDLCVAKLYPPNRGGLGNPSSSMSVPTTSANKQPPNVVRCEASRDLKWTIENTGVMSPIYKIVNQDDTPLYQISKPNPNAEFWTMFYFKYAGHQIPPKRIEFGRVAKNPPEKGGGTRITITGKSEDEKQIWQTLGVGNEDCVEWVVCCACLNLLDDQILQAAEKRNGPIGPASTNSASSPAATRPPLAQLQRPGTTPRSAPSPIGANGNGNGMPGRPGGGIASTAPMPMRGAPPPSRPGPGPGPGIASTSSLPSHPASNLAQTYRQQLPPRMNSGGPSQGMGPGGYRGPPPPATNGQPQQQYPQQGQGQYGAPSPGAGPGTGGYDPRRGPPMQGPPPPQQGAGRNVMHRAPPAGAGGRRF